MKRPARSLRSWRAGSAQPARFAGAEQCSANSPLHPPRGGAQCPSGGRAGTERAIPAFPAALRHALLAPFLALTLTLLALAAPAPAAAQAEAPAPAEAQPVAPDPELEARVQALAHKLRCLVCQNQSIAESNAPLAVDLRNQVREQLAAGKDEDAVVDYLVARYGDFVLYLPPFKGITVLLWLGPALLLVACVAWLALRLRNRARESAAAPHLSAEEHARARALLEGDALPPQEPRP